MAAAGATGGGKGEQVLKIILLGDSAVGKSKLVGGLIVLLKQRLECGGRRGGVVFRFHRNFDSTCICSSIRAP